MISFYGDGYRDDFTGLNISDCIGNISEFINKRVGLYEAIFGIGISLGGSLLLEHAKKYNNLKGIIGIGVPFKLKNKTHALGTKIIAHHSSDLESLAENQEIAPKSDGSRQHGD